MNKNALWFLAILGLIGLAYLWWKDRMELLAALEAHNSRINELEALHARQALEDSSRSAWKAEALTALIKFATALMNFFTVPFHWIFAHFKF